MKKIYICNFIKKLDRLQLFLENILKVPKEVFQEIRLVATFFGKNLAESHKRFIKKLDRLQLCFVDILTESPERYYKKLDRLQLFLVSTDLTYNKKLSRHIISF